MVEHGKCWFQTKKSKFTMLLLRIFLKNPQRHCGFFVCYININIRDYEEDSNAMRSDARPWVNGLQDG